MAGGEEEEEGVAERSGDDAWGDIDWDGGGYGGEEDEEDAEEDYVDLDAL